MCDVMSLLTTVVVTTLQLACTQRIARAVEASACRREKSNSEMAKIRYNLEVYRAENHTVRSVCNTESNGLGPKKLWQTVPQSNALRIWPFCTHLDRVATWLHAVTSSPGSG